ncbi:G patch domain-containing protein 4 isoform X2 [Cuculus canorus]|uniref:G patch domain-containing protein 4 isoform X2 n=1 Tax=Cuculus canorus TaxID=55661 RepID=UPI0023AB0F07|nr:G patch domain-containing protein 4 isoform X2 [Cuculus canorus]
MDLFSLYSSMGVGVGCHVRPLPARGAAGAMAGAEPPGRGMRFAERQLERHGWRPGQGLGKREDGIAEAIRVKMKCDTAGVGHDVAEPFSFHWWDHVFNKAAANIAVEAGQDGVSVKALSEQGVRISNKKPRKADGAATMLYGRFVKSAMLTARGEESTKLPAGSESSEDEEEEKLDLSSAKRLTDEELMRACGGRTAHKGARHGLTMSAKLARLEEQERAFLATYHHKEQQQEPLKNPTAGRQEKRKKKKRKRADPEVLQNREPGGEEEVVGEEEKVRKRKKKKNQEPSGEEEVKGEEKVLKRKKKRSQEPSGEEVLGEEEKVVKRKKNQEPSGEEEVAGKEGKAAKRNKKQQQQEEKEEPVETKKDRKKKKEEEEDNEEPNETEVLLEDTDGPDQAGHSPRKKKKKKRKRESE